MTTVQISDDWGTPLPLMAGWMIGAPFGEDRVGWYQVSKASRERFFAADRPTIFATEREALDFQAAVCNRRNAAPEEAANDLYRNTTTANYAVVVFRVDVGSSKAHSQDGNAFGWIDVDGWHC